MMALTAKCATRASMQPSLEHHNVKPAKRAATRMSMASRSASSARPGRSPTAGAKNRAWPVHPASMQIPMEAPTAKPAPEELIAMPTRMAYSAILPISLVGSYLYQRAQTTAMVECIGVFMALMVAHASLVDVGEIRRGKRQQLDHFVAAAEKALAGT
mmetsp:Transcript_83433/g.152630  ORF Transcript_83433/g.152630 Transcript_83433/m.152630 type:complete len:158 (-) Transcript_83433:3145-3618(-)